MTIIRVVIRKKEHLSILCMNFYLSFMSLINGLYYLLYALTEGIFKIIYSLNLTFSDQKIILN